MDHKFVGLILLGIVASLCCHQVHGEHDPLSSITNKLLSHLFSSSESGNDELKKSGGGVPQELKDAKHGVVMGVVSDKCDDAKTNLTKDWDGSALNYTCFSWKYPLPVNEDVESIITCDTIPENYSPPHYCMDQEVHYSSLLPTFEGHRPLWPIFGEYQFVPTQRWLHNVEHGAVILLYHPCAEPSEIMKLKKLVKSCLWKYVITPWNMLPRDKPFALVAWGCRLQMGKADLGIARYFIRSKAFKGPEAHYLKQGQYSVGLLEPSNPPSDTDFDKVLC